MYTGAVQTPFESLDAKIEVVGAKDATNAGIYTCTLKLKKVEGYSVKWSDGTSTDKTVTWKIDKKSIAIPTPKTAVFMYDGAVHTLEFNDWNSYSSYVAAECSSEKNADTYECVLKLKDTTNLSWIDGTITNKSIKWSIITPGVEEYDPSTDVNLGKTLIFTYKVNNSTQNDKWMIVERLYKNVYAIQSMSFGRTCGVLGQSDYDYHEDLSFVAGGIKNSLAVPSYLQNIEASGGRNRAGTYSPYTPQNHMYLVPSTTVAPPANVSIADSNGKGKNYYVDAMMEVLNASQYNVYAALADPTMTGINNNERAYKAVNKSGKVVNLSVENMWYNNSGDQFPAFNLDISKVSIDASGNVTVK